MQKRSRKKWIGRVQQLDQEYTERFLDWAEVGTKMCSSMAETQAEAGAQEEDLWSCFHIFSVWRGKILIQDLQLYILEAERISK